MTGRSQLLEELNRIAANCGKFLGMAREEHYGFKPQDNMRTMLELANHMAQIPAVDLKIMKGSLEEDVVKLEDDLKRDNNDDLQAVLKEGTEGLYRFMEKLTLDEYENGSGTAYYGRTQTHASWLLEVITHLYHHRAQLFMYLKLNGYDVNTRTLYS